MNNRLCFWSDNASIEDGKMWCVDADKNILFCIDYLSGSCEQIVAIPNEGKNAFRQNQYCAKIDHSIYCMPDCGDSIWIYHIDEQQFHKIDIHNPQKARLAFTHFWILDGKIYTVSVGLKQIIVIDICREQVVGYHSLKTLEEESLSSDAVMVEHQIYMASKTRSVVYAFCIDTCQVRECEIPNVKNGFGTICYDGKNFWLSSVQEKKIYVWNEEKNEVSVLDSFPEGFGIYDFKKEAGKLVDTETVHFDVQPFLHSEYAENKVWFFPFQTNKILWTDKNILQLQSFEIQDGDATDYEDLSQMMLLSPYQYEYLYQSRYMGVYSFMKGGLLEIDSETMTVKEKNFNINEKLRNRYFDLIVNNIGFCRETREFDLNFLLRRIS